MDIITLFRLLVAISGQFPFVSRCQRVPLYILLSFELSGGFPWNLCGHHAARSHSIRAHLIVYRQ